MDPLWRVFLLLLCAPAPPLSSPLSSHTAPPGLSCVSDYVRNITCDWSSSGVAPDAVAPDAVAPDAVAPDAVAPDAVAPDAVAPDAVAPDAACRIQASGSGCVDQSCALEPVDIPEAKIHRCGFACTLRLNSAVRLKFLRVKCGDTVMTEIRNFRPLDHIKMNPPGVPQIHTSSNHTSLSWGPGAPLSTFITGYNFQVQIKQEPQKWEDSLIFTSSMLEPSLTVKQMKQAGVYQVRVRVRPEDQYKAQWSDWSPSSSWWAAGEGEGEGGSTDSPDGKTLDWTSLVLCCVMVAVFTVIIILLLICKACAKKRKHHQNVPDPAKYFHTLNSVHNGNFQKWLSPMFAADDFLPALPCEDVSLLEVAEPVPSICTCTSTCTCTCTSVTSAHGWSGGEGSGQSSSSCFSNISYFLSNLPAHQHVESWPTYFTYEEDLLHPLHPCHPRARLPLPRADSYELLLCPGTSSTGPGRWKEPSSPDSGISEGSHLPSEDEDSVNDMGTVRFTHSPPLLLPPLIQVAWLVHHGGTTAPPGLSQDPSPPEEPPPTLEGDSSLGVGGSYSAWPVDGALGRSSSMTVRPDGGGYLTIKELQTTCSKKSI